MPETHGTVASALEGVSVHDHLCLIYESQEDSSAAVVPFVRQGLAAGQRCIYLADDNTAEAVGAALHSDGIDVDAESARGALQILTKPVTCLRDGHFDPDGMIALLEEATAAAKADGFSALRMTGDMTWVLSGEPGTDRLVEYEAKLNSFLPDHDALAICQYNLCRFGPEVIMNVIRTHPTVISGGLLCDNAYYVPPDDFLQPDQPAGEVDRVLRNIVAAQRSRQTLEQASRHWSATFGAMNDMVCLLAQDGTVLRCNSTMANLLGLGIDEVIGKKCYELMHGSNTFVERCPYQEMLRTGKHEDFELPLGESWYQVIADPLFGKAEEIVGAVHVVRDITARKRTESKMRTLNASLERRVQKRTRELIAANRELQEVVYSLSHDLRSPLRAIDGFSLAVLEEYSAIIDEQGRSDLHRVRAAAQRMGELIDALLSLSRLGRREVDFGQVDLSAIARRVIDELRETDPGRSVEIVIEDGLFAEADTWLVDIVLQNLLGNAWKFTAQRPSAHIEFGCTQRDGQPVFFVRDDGAGFDPAYVDKLFTPFERLHTAEQFPGTGVGLATVARVLGRLGARWWAEGEVDRGATFLFTLSGDDAQLPLALD